MTCYAGESLPGYDSWRTREPDLPPEEEPLEYCLTVELVIAASLDPVEAREEAQALADDVLALLRAQARRLDAVDRVDDCVVSSLELA